MNTFVTTVITSDVATLARDLSSTAVKQERTLAKLADTIFSNGGRMAHFVATKDESGEDKIIRLEMVRQWDLAFIEGCTPAQKKSLSYVKGEVPEEYKAERKNAQTKVKVYRDRFIKALNTLENPAPVSAEGEEGEGDKAPKSKKTREEQIVARLQDALKYLQELEDAKFDIVAVTHNVETALATIAKSA